MRGVRFNDYHTGNDWRLILNAKSLTPPEPKTNYITVDGRDGDIDLSEALTGEVKYENRTASFTFLLTEGTYLEREALINEITGYLHGRVMEITTDDDPLHYLSGRCKITDVSNVNSFGSISIEANCDPWRYSINDTILNHTITKATEIICPNFGTKSLIPELTVTGDISIAFDNQVVSLASGTHKITDLIVRNGGKILNVSGSGTLVIKYREAVL